MSDIPAPLGSPSSDNSPGSDDVVQLPRTRKGEIKRRLSLEEKLRILDPTEKPELTIKRLRAFINLFAYRRDTGGIITRAHGDHRSWTALRGPILDELVIRHLLGDRLLPAFNPRWVGARSAYTTLWGCLDIDPDRPSKPRLSDAHSFKDLHALGYRDHELFKKDLLREQRSKRHRLSFSDRCLLVDTALRRMGLDPEDSRQVLRLPTPSGGRHYYIFLEGPHFIYQVNDLFESSGLRHIPSQVEFFPSRVQGFRLPFGYIPGRPTDYRAWIDFIDDYSRGIIRRHSLAELYDKVLNNQHQAPTRVTHSSRESGSRERESHAPDNGPPASLGVPHADVSSGSRISQLGTPTEHDLGR